MRSASIKQYSRFRTSVRQSYGIFYFITPIAIIISSTMFMELGYYQNWSVVRLLFRRHHSGLISVIMISWSCSQSHQLLAALIDLVDHRPRLASPSEGRVLVTRGPNRVWASLHPGAQHLALWYVLASSRELRLVRTSQSVSSAAP